LNEPCLPARLCCTTAQPRPVRSSICAAVQTGKAAGGSAARLQSAVATRVRERPVAGLHALDLHAVCTRMPLLYSIRRVSSCSPNSARQLSNNAMRCGDKCLKTDTRRTPTAQDQLRACGRVQVNTAVLAWGDNDAPVGPGVVQAAGAHVENLRVAGIAARHNIAAPGAPCSGLHELICMPEATVTLLHIIPPPCQAMQMSRAQ